MLGYGVDILEGVSRVPDRRLERFETALGTTWAACRKVLGRNVARVVGHIMTMRLALGPIARISTGALYQAIYRIPHLGLHVNLDADACRELVF